MSVQNVRHRQKWREVGGADIKSDSIGSSENAGRHLEIRSGQGKLTDSQSNNIQILRGLAIAAVVFIHNTPEGLAQVYCRPFFNFAVGLFLLLSGMLSNKNNWKPQKRIIKVAIPYMLWSLVYVILYNYKTPATLFVCYLKNLFTGKAAAPMYYVFVYSEFMLLIPLIDGLAKSRYKYMGFLIGPTEIICMRLLPLLTGCRINKYIEHKNGTNYVDR